MATLNLQSCFCCNKIVFKDYLLFFPSKACNCSDTGSINLQCDVLTGQCQCKAEFGGQDCSRCALGYRDYPDCVACDCDLSGTTAEMCDDTEGLCGCEEETGICTCKVLKYSDFFETALGHSDHLFPKTHGSSRAERDLVCILPLRYF